MRTIARPDSRRSRSRSRMIPAWTVTSSAVVGSSATSSFGPARQRDRRSRSAGACRPRTGADRRAARPPGRGSAPRAEARARARPQLSAPARGGCGRARSAAFRRTASGGATSSGPGRPSRARGRRSRRSSRGGSRSRSRPAKTALPSTAAPGGSSPISASTDIVFPLPLSPAIPKTSPGSTW